jgi:hypothetical protein
MIRNPLPDGDYLRSILTYEPDTGLLRWLVERGGSKVGDIAGAMRGEDGYIQISIDRKLYRAHLIAWKMVRNVDPAGPLDHDNTKKWDNSWSNLRLATKSLNEANIGITAANTSGLKGASRYRQGEAWGNGWQAQIVKDGKHYHLGHFATKEDAHAAYCDRAKELFGDFARVK